MTDAVEMKERMSHLTSQILARGLKLRHQDGDWYRIKNGVLVRRSRGAHVLLGARKVQDAQSDKT